MKLFHAVNFWKYMEFLPVSQVPWLTPVIPATQETEIGGSGFEADSDKKLAKPCLKNKLGVVVHAGNLSHAGGKGRKITVQAWPWQKMQDCMQK
jgi:hypothetical protein